MGVNPEDLTEDQRALIAGLREDAENRYMAGDLGALRHSVAHKPHDPAFFLLLDGKTSKPVVHHDGCYICEDPEFAALGLPLCRSCADCMRNGRGLGHIPADDGRCDECGYEDGPDDYPPENLIMKLSELGFEPPYTADVITVPQAESYTSEWSEKDGLVVMGLPTCVITEVQVRDIHGKPVGGAQNLNRPLMAGDTLHLGRLEIG